MMEIQVGALIFAGMGLLFLLLGLFLMKVFGRRRQTATMITTARVVDVECKRDSNGSTYYYPVFEYYAGGRMQQVVSTFGSSPCRYQTGEKTELHYDPEKPEKFWCERDTKMMKLLCGIFMGIGGIFLVLGIVFMVTGAF
ncbi:DUF3592 domain-containing protein [Eisenbergiella sp.]